MQSVYLPRRTCDEIDRICRDFLWGGSRNNRRFHAIGWNKVYMAKEYGGLGLRSIRNVNTSFMMKNCWSLITEPHKLWVQVVRSKYKCPQGAIPQVGKKNKMSNLWQGICATWNFVTPHICWRVKNGQSTRFWYDAWLPSHTSIIQKALTFVPPAELMRTVRSYRTSQGAWNIEHLQAFLPVTTLETIRDQHIGNEDEPDEIIWGPTFDGEFKIKSAYEVTSTCLGNVRPPIFRVVWKWTGLERIHTFLWRVVHDSLLTNLARFERNLGPDPTCPICLQGIEDSIHVLRDCPFAREVWNKIPGGSTAGNSTIRSIQNWIMVNLSKRRLGAVDWLTTFAVTLDSIWHRRNKFIFHNSSISAD
uniref:Ribonuclease H protein At1g65750 family n=1 Tax=Cajanus cajan TaxID=3821 RepID=A0A151R145_CAJCA|nr:Putative ribonuclease H protein At1g65750 family [Cajanus cajan]